MLSTEDENSTKGYDLEPQQTAVQSCVIPRRKCSMRLYALIKHLSRLIGMCRELLHIYEVSLS